MGRRKKEPGAFHKKNIADAAEHLFFKKGIAWATMDEIAKEANYSKATLYVYYKSKEEIICELVYRSMIMLFSRMSCAVGITGNTLEQYHNICTTLVQYQEQYPYYFDFALSEIQKSCPLEDHEQIFEAGERLNALMVSFLHTGIENGTFRPNLAIPETIFTLWASLSGIILMADRKRNYLKESLGIRKQDFLDYGFQLLYRSIQKNDS